MAESEISYREYARDLTIIAVISLIPRLIYLALMPDTVLSHDMLGWSRAAEKFSEGINPYSTSYINAPPFWMQFLFVFSKIADALQISIYPVIRSFLLTAELVVMSVTYLFLRQSFKYERALLTVLFGMSLNPVCIILVCQHCQFDLLISLWALLMLISLISFHRTGKTEDWLSACLFLGLNILTKTLPFVLIPLITYRFRILTKRTLFMGLYLVFFPVILGISVLYVLDPVITSKYVINYMSVPGYFGLTGLLHLLGGGENAFRIYMQVSFGLILAVMVGATAYFRESKNITKKKLMIVCMLLFIVLPALGPGYGPQYLSWYLPLLVMIYALYPNWRKLLMPFYVIAVLTYTLEYALLKTHGQFLVEYTGSEEWRKLGAMLGTMTSQTLFRIPLFVLHLLIIFFGIKELKKA